MTQTPATVPVTPEGRALARRLLAALDGPAKLHAFGELGLMAAKKQFAEQAQSAPAAQRAVVERAYFDALSEAQAHYEARAIDRMVDYYAHHLSPDDMTAATAFYASPLGARVVRPNPPLTEEERQEVGRAMLESPALQRVTAVQLALMKDQQAGSAREQARLVADTKAGFCRRLAAAHFKSPACVGAVQATASR